MKDDDALKKFREGPSESPSGKESARRRLDAAIDASASRESHARRIAKVGALLVGCLAAALIVTSLPRTPDEQEPTAGEPGSLREFRQTLSSYSSADFTSLAAADLSLEDVEREARIVGIGRISDVRLAYEDDDGLQHMYIVIEPESIEKGSDDLGTSGEVLIDEIAPPLDVQTGDRGLDQLREQVTASPERVAFLLSPAPDVDSDQGKATDDPVLEAAQPSSVVAINEDTGVAFPLLTDEKIRNSAENLGPLDELGAEVDRFAKGSSELAVGE